MLNDNKWSLALYGKDTFNCNLYDMVLHIDTMTVEDVVDVLSGMVEKGRFDATPESLQAASGEDIARQYPCQDRQHFSPGNGGDPMMGW